MAHPRHPVLDSDRVAAEWPSRWQALSWFAGGCVLAFSTAWLGADLLNLNRDLYYLVYFTLALSFVAAFLGRTGVAWHELLRRRVAWSLALGAVVAVPAVLNVLEDVGTPRPSGAYLAFEIVWRGLVYGVVDALILYVFPALVVLLLMRGNTTGLGRRLVFAGLAAVLVATITAAYHLGYRQYRDEDLRNPEIGAMVSSVPTFLTANPAGAVVTHTAVHVSAVVHEYEGGNYLPPARTAGRERLDGPAGGVVAAAWLLLTAGIWWWEVVGHRDRGLPRKRRPPA